MNSQSDVNASPAIARQGIWAGRLLGGVIAAIGVVLAAGGLWLILLGGSLYYLMSGIGYVVVGFLLSRRRPAGALLALALLAATLAWALWEAGFDYWALLPRVMLPAGLGLLALLAALRFPENESRRMTASVAGALALAMAVEVALAFVPHGVVRNAPSRAFVSAEKSAEPSDWSSYGRTPAGTRYSPFTQITRDNVQGLKPVWTFRSGDTGPGVDQNTPLQIGDFVYTCSRNNHVAALDADTGEVRWRYSPEATSPFWQRCRGLGYYQLPDAPTGSASARLCSRRIIGSTIDARLIALDAITGTRCPDFGTNGVVDLKRGMGQVPSGFYFQTSAPIIARGRIIIGGWVVDNQQVGEPSGVVRAFDARTGKLVWAWDIGNPGNTGEPLPGREYTRGTPNMWSTPAYDDALGLVYVPLGNETPDYFGMGRNPASDRYSASVTALDIDTGLARWSVQTVHHDIWDYDVPSQPALVELPDGDGNVIPALLQTTKRGQIFLLNRATGQPISRIVERPVPQTGAAPEETLSPTQPYSVDMPVIGAERLDERKAWGMTMLDQLACRISFRQHRYDGDFTPIGLTPTLEQPGNAGGLNWGSVSVDTVNHIAFMNDIRLPSRFWLVTRAKWPETARRYLDDGAGHGPSPQGGTPYGQITMLWLSALGVPCNQPPFGTVTAVDLLSRKVLWQVPAGTAEELGPFGIKSHMPAPIGMPAYAGTSVTAGGLLFFAGTQDFYIRAYDTQTGEELWKHRLPVGSSATPMTYISPSTGRQYVLVSAGGAAHSSVTGDYVVAYALPDAPKLPRALPITE